MLRSPPPLSLSNRIFPIPFFHEEFFFLSSDSVRFRFSSESGTIKREEEEGRFEEALRFALCKRGFAILIASRKAGTSWNGACQDLAGSGGATGGGVSSFHRLENWPGSLERDFRFTGGRRRILYMPARADRLLFMPLSDKCRSLSRLHVPL